jgi:hypothetical protein
MAAVPFHRYRTDPAPEANKMSDSTSFTDTFSKFVPGFEFLQGLVKNAGQTLPSIGQWVAPTLDPEELDRRISELRTVQFWLDQNARMIGTTVQALEVQRMTLGTLKSMTLGTLKTMNVQMGDLSEVLKVRSMADMFHAPAPAPAAAPAPAFAPPPAAEAGAGTAAAAGAVDPMQWWGALTQQFTQLATQAMQATSDATTGAQARAAEVMAEAVKGAVSTAAETVASAKPVARKAAAQRAAPHPEAPAPKAAPATKAPARKSAKG